MNLATRVTSKSERQMIRRQKFSLIVVMILGGLLFFSVTAHAQTTGKIAGRIIDAQTRETLVGVNVHIDGTTIGATTDDRGEYVILGVRPGVHTVVASYIGYQTVRTEGVQVNVDLTTTVDFDLREQVYEGQEVVVTAEAITVRRDLTSAEARVTAETIKNMPVQEVGDILSTKAGITTSGSGIHIRGGRSSEVAFFIDGVRVSDAYDGGISVQVENQAIQELQVISGTYNAEYGQAMSGIINVVTKEGGNSFGGSFEGYTGGYVSSGSGGDAYLYGSDPGAVSSFPFQGVDPYGFMPFNASTYYNGAVSLEGPIIPDRLTFFASGRYFKNDGWLYGASLYHIDGTPADSALRPMNDFERYSGQVNLRLQLNRSMHLNLIALGSSSTSRNFDHGWRWAPEGRPFGYDDGYNVNLKFTHMVGSRTFYTLNLANYLKNYRHFLFEDPLDPRYNDFLINPPDDVVTGGGRFLRGGTDLGRFERRSISYLAKGDITSQVHRNHQIKAGFEARIDRLSLTGYSLIPALTEDNVPIEPFQPAIPDPTSLDYQSYDNVDPLSISAYLQDKLEFENMVVNVGLRVDYFDSRGQVLADSLLDDPNVYSPFQPHHAARPLEERMQYWYRDASAKWQFSPRFGIAYPITESGVIHFSYGHFLQVPTFLYLFNNPGYKVSTVGQIYGVFGNADLEPQRTVMYEIGLQQEIIPGLVADITGFYRDVRNWVSTSVPFETVIPGVSYIQYVNRDYSNIRGVTLTLTKSFSDNYAFDLDYTFQVAEGSNSSPEAEYHARQGNLQPSIALLPLDWDQRHTLNAHAYVGFSGWGLSTIARFGSGYPYTPSFQQAQPIGRDVSSSLPTNSRRKPTTFNVDVNAFREFDLGPVSPRLFVQVYNVFDRRNVNNVFGDTGRPDMTLDQRIVGFYDSGYYVRPDFYSEPRRIQVGMSLNF